jgi:hypothetical protein
MDCPLDDDRAASTITHKEGIDAIDSHKEKENNLEDEEAKVCCSRASTVPSRIRIHQALRRALRNSLADSIQLGEGWSHRLRANCEAETHSRIRARPPQGRGYQV